MEIKVRCFVDATYYYKLRLLLTFWKTYYQQVTNGKLKWEKP